MYTHSGPLSKDQRGSGIQCTDTKYLYLKVRAEVGTKCSDTQDLYLKVTGEVEDSVKTLRICI